MSMFNGVDFVFISDEDPRSLITRFIADNDIKFDQESWEYPWAVEDVSTSIEFFTFEEILNHVLTQDKPEYLFYPAAGLDCWFGVVKDRSVVFGIQYTGDSPEMLANFANRYGGKFGFVSIIDAPDLDGMSSFKSYNNSTTYELNGFILFDPEWVYENCQNEKIPDSPKGFFRRLFSK